jgi:hypothetical protein
MWIENDQGKRIKIPGKKGKNITLGGVHLKLCPEWHPSVSVPRNPVLGADKGGKWLVMPPSF